MTTEAFNDWVSTLYGKDLTAKRHVASELLGVSIRTIYHYAKGSGRGAAISKPSQLLIQNHIQKKNDLIVN